MAISTDRIILMELQDVKICQLLTDATGSSAPTYSDWVDLAGI